MELFTYKRYVVKVSDSVTIAELTKDYEIMEQNKDGTLVIREKRSNGKS
jgi:DNA integrity scanning protein DisA with diadenylate cyclase activity